MTRRFLVELEFDELLAVRAKLEDALEVGGPDFMGTARPLRAALEALDAAREVEVGRQRIRRGRIVEVPGL